MAIRIVRLGTPRHAGEGLRIGTVPAAARRAQDRLREAGLLRRLAARAGAHRAARLLGALEAVHARSVGASYARRYLREMREPAAQRQIALLAALSARTDFSVGCYCEDESRCHRSLLRDLLIQHGAKVV